MSSRRSALTITIVLNLAGLGSGWADEPRFTLKAGAEYGFDMDGFVQVREWDLIGTKLKLQKDLGLDHFDSVYFSGGMKIGPGWLDVDYTRYGIEGEDSFDSTVNFNGAVFAPGPVSINKSNYDRFLVQYLYQYSGSRLSPDSLDLSFGLLIESLRVHINADFDPSSTRFEKFEGFNKQKFPVPSLGAHLKRPVMDGLGYALGFDLAYLPQTKTTYQEGGSMRFAQTNLDLVANLIYPIRNIELDVGYHFKSFHQKQESDEDTNEFLISGSIITGGLRGSF